MVFKLSTRSQSRGISVILFFFNALVRREEARYWDINTEVVSPVSPEVSPVSELHVH